MRALAAFEDRAYALLRIAAGAMFAFHGLQKVFGVLGEAKPIGSQLWIGGVIELAAGTAVALGLATRPAAFLASGMMAVAYVQFHWRLRGGTALLPAINQGELAALYAWLFLFIACRGAGRWGLDVRRPPPA